LSRDQQLKTFQPEERAGILRYWLALSRGEVSLEALASVATIVGTFVSIFGIIESRAWLALISLFFVLLSIVALIQARKAHAALESASIVIEGHSIDSLNVANLRRRVTRNFVIQEDTHTVRIEGEDMEITWKHSGFCRGQGEAAMLFSVDSDANAPFEQLNCVAYDLGHDPDMKHEIHPLLVSTEGISKKISVPFLRPLEHNDPFSVLFRYISPKSVKPGFDYYTSTLSFAQRRVRRSTVKLVFAGSTPKWVRVYECLPQRPPALVKTLAPVKQEPCFQEYLDEVPNRPANSARVYAFWRD
jgi:hypothetical protein